MAKQFLAHRPPLEPAELSAETEAMADQFLHQLLTGAVAETPRDVEVLRSLVARVRVASRWAKEASERGEKYPGGPVPILAITLLTERWHSDLKATWPTLPTQVAADLYPSDDFIVKQAEAIARIQGLQRKN